MQLVGLHVRPGKRGDVYKFKMDLWRDKVWIRTVYMTLGRVDSMPLEQAQAEAAKLAGMVRRGVDPTRPEGGLDPLTMTVKQLIDHYSADAAVRGKGDRYRNDVVTRTERYLSAWLNRPFTSITRAECRSAHDRITKNHGPRAANQTLKGFGTAWKVALQTLDDVPSDIPTLAIRMNPERAADYSSFSWAEWIAVRSRATNVTADAMLFTALSGLRKANVLGLQRDWVKDDRVIIPRSEMKIKDPRRGPFVLPCSEQMLAVLERRLRSTNSALLFPTSRLPLAHAVRHMHYTTGQSLGLSQTTIDLLHDHAFEGMGKVYGSRQHFPIDNLTDAQNRISLALGTAMAANRPSTTPVNLEDEARQ